jgi:hypothetical protein
MTPILLLDEYLVDSLRDSLQKALDAQDAQALGIAFTCTADYIDFHDMALKTLTLQNNGDILEDEGDAKKWIFHFVRYDENFQYPLWTSTHKLCEALGGGKMTLMAWFFQDKLVVERIDAPGAHLHIAAHADHLSHHEKMTLTQDLIQFSKNWTTHPQTRQLLSTLQE